MIEKLWNIKMMEFQVFLEYWWIYVLIAIVCIIIALCFAER